LTCIAPENSNFNKVVLSEKETRKLLDRLETHGALGFLAEKPHEQRIKAFMDAAGRQLLVALHEATLGKPFEEIVLDEYRRIPPDEARVLYLDVCTLNRLGAPVRAGLIPRVSGIHFEEFQRRFLNPLRYIVIVRHDKYSQDYVYAARHPHVADILFEQALKDPEQRFNQIVRVLRGINLDYTSDETAFRLLTRGRTVTQMFTSQELGRRFYDVGEEVLPNDPFLLQQRGIFEMAHKGGSLELAETYIQKATALKPSDRSIRHSQATLAREQALTATIPLHRARLRMRARDMLSGLIASDAANPYDFHTKALVAVDELRDLLSETAYGPIDQMAERRLLDAVRDAQLAISNGLQHFPENDRLLTVDADFLELINQHDEAETALRKAFTSNPRQDWIAVRLSRKYLARKDTPRALEILNECLNNNPGSKLAHLEMAKLRMASGDIKERSFVREHLRRSFTEGDSNFDAQFWYARELFLNHEHEAAQRLFSKLKESSLPPYVRRQLRGFVFDSDGHNMRFAATVIRKEATYCFLRCGKFQPAIFAHISNVESDWGQVTVGCEVEFSLGFTMTGAQACDVRIILQR
jgi:tetratricopeptide (TPR) repeat protein